MDLGSSHCHQTIINSDGLVIHSRSVPTSEQHLRNAFADLGGNVHVHAEASELSDWVRVIINPLVSRFVISHPRSLAWIAKDSVKDDAVDARKLAELLRFNLVHEVYYEDRADRRSFKHLVVHQENLSREQARLKSKIKAASELSASFAKINEFALLARTKRRADWELIRLRRAKRPKRIFGVQAE